MSGAVPAATGSQHGRRARRCAAGLLAAGLATTAVIGAPLDEVVITATRVPEPKDQIPADISVVPGSELAARGAVDLAGALSLVPGVEAPAGGDAGPSSAVPSFWGLHEFDAFLLVVDGVPWGGAFNPAITSLDLTDVERIEVLKGAAPVMFGATAFVGVVQVLHYPAGAASDAADIAYGSYGSERGSAAFALPHRGDYRQSFAIDGQSQGFADPRARVADERLLYRGALDAGGGTWQIDADGGHVRDVPPSPVLRTGAALTALTPIDANFNPADAKIDEDKTHLALGYTRPTAWGAWDTRVSFAHSDIADVRAFLHPDRSGTADTQNQRRRIDDDYLDSHVTRRLAPKTTLLAGADALYGLGRQTTLNGNDAYTVPLNGSVIPPPASAVAVNEIGRLVDRRIFTGQYAQLDWKIGQRWDLLGGIRLNETLEKKASSDLVLPPPQLAATSVRKTLVKPAETLGASYRLMVDGADEAVVYADYRNAFKPAALDFGPDYTPALLSPETAVSYEGGLKGAAAGGRLRYQAELFWLNFDNLVVATRAGALANAGKQRLKGVELETLWQAAPTMAFALNGSYHDARYRQYLYFDGVHEIEVAGRELPLSPHILASAGLLYTPRRGLGATLITDYVGRRYLDELNGAVAGGYTKLDATLSYRFGRCRLGVEASNVTNRRPPVTASEFGSESFYLLPARTLWLRIAYTLPR